MNQVRTPLALVALVAMLACCSAASAATPREVPRGFHAVMYDGELRDAPLDVQQRQFDLMARSGVESIRTVFDWARVQATPGAAIDFTPTDRIVELTSARGITILPVMLQAPRWARVFKQRAASPPRLSPYQAYLRAMIRRYGPRGSFWGENPGIPRRPLREWQIWNEPTLRTYWDVSPKNRRYGWPQGYSDLLRAANKAIKAEDPGARTVMGGFVGFAWDDLKQIYRHGGGNSFDVMALNAYTQTEARVHEALRRVRRVLGKAGDEKKRIFLTEVSFPASRGGAKPIPNQRQETPRTMAERLTNVFALLARRRTELGLDRVYWYTWSSGYRPTSNFQYGGLLASPDGLTFKPQPALGAFRRSALRLQGCAKNSVGDCR